MESRRSKALHSKLATLWERAAIVCLEQLSNWPTRQGEGHQVVSWTCGDVHLHQPHRWRDEFGLGQPERALKFLFGRSDGLRQDFGWSSSNPTGRCWAPWRPLNGMPLFGTGTAFICTVWGCPGTSTHGRLMATWQCSRVPAPPTDRQPRRAAPNLHLQSSSGLPSRLAPTAIPCRVLAGPIARDAVASAWSPPPCPGRRCELAIRLAPAQACLDQSHVSRHTRGEGRRSRSEQ